jgi:hypothetical protein
LSASSGSNPPTGSKGRLRIGQLGLAARSSATPITASRYRRIPAARGEQIAAGVDDARWLEGESERGVQGGRPGEPLTEDEQTKKAARRRT